MKKLVFSLIACLVAGTSFAGSETVSTRSSKEYKPSEEMEVECFRAQELSIDVFGSYNDARSRGSLDVGGNGFRRNRRNTYSDSFGGGLGLNYFFTKHIGVGFEGNWSQAGRGDTVIHALSASLIARFPFDSICLAPYIFIGGGANLDGSNIGTAHAGAGLEYRFNPNMGIFGDGRYTATGSNANDIATYRLGMRFAF